MDETAARRDEMDRHEGSTLTDEELREFLAGPWVCKLGTLTKDGAPYVTDDNTYVLDCRFGPIAEPARLADEIKGLVGVVEHGLFIGLADRVIVAGHDGVRTYDRQ